MTKRGYKGSKPVAASEDPSTKATVEFVPTASWQLLPPALSVLKDNTTTVLTVIVIPGLLIHLGTVLIGDGQTPGTPIALGGILTVIGVTWILLSLAASYYLQLRAIGGFKPGIRESYAHSIRYLPRLVGLMAITSLVVLIGLLMLVVPGAIWFRRYILAPYYLVDHDLGIREAMQRSAADSKPVHRYIWGTLGVVLVLALLALGLRKLSPAYGPVIGTFLGCVYSMILALRYKETALHQSALTIKD